MNEQDLSPTTDTEQRNTDYVWLLSCALVAAVAAFLRFFALDLKPLHHDEGVNGYFLTTLFREGVYKYDPANYHGPTLYYISLAFSKAFGLNTWSVRASVGVFGVIIVAMAFALHRYLGKTGSLFAGLFLALSPGMVYISRYFIHEIFFIFCSFGIVVALVFFIEKRKAGWLAILTASVLLLICFLPSALNLANVLGGANETLVWVLRAVFFLVEAALVFVVMRMLVAWQDGRPVYFLLAAAATVLFFATKETAFITLGTMAIACVCVYLWRRINANESFARNKFWVFLTLSILAPAALLLKVGDLTEGYRMFAEFFVVEGDAYQAYVFYAILLLGLASWLVWLAFLFLNRGPGEPASELDEPAALTWTGFRERTTAADTREYLLVKSALGGLSIFAVWFFVRYLVDLMTAWKAGRPLSSALDKIALGRVDFWILAFGAGALALAGVLWLRRRPTRVSPDLVLLLAAGAGLFLYVGALFFSSFFSYPEGLKGAFEAYAIWTKTGNTDHTQNGFWAYLRWGLQLEAPLLILALLGFLIAHFKARHRFAMFAGLWAFGLFAAYTLIPYKTPWLALSYLLPMGLAAGYAINELMSPASGLRLRLVGGLLAATATGVLAYQTYDINFVRYDSDRLPYIYAHTRREFLDLVKQIEYYADKSGKKYDAAIEIVSPDYWPLPWYLNDYKTANFHGRFVDATNAEMIVAKKDEQDAEVLTRYAPRYKYVGSYTLRPGVELRLFVRRALADSDAQEIYQMTGAPLEITPAESLPGSTPVR